MMLSANKYQLFVSNKCCCCDKILSHLKKENITITTINIDNEAVNLPFSLTILPALVKEKKLISYGFDDIITQLKRA